MSIERSLFWVLGRAHLLAVAAGLSAIGCGEDELACHPSTGTAAADGDGTASYEAHVTGDAHIDTVIYQNDSGPVTVKSPPLPFELDVDVTDGTLLGISASGTAEEGGNVFVSYVFNDNAGVSPRVTSAQCR